VWEAVAGELAVGINLQRMPQVKLPQTAPITADHARVTPFLMKRVKLF